MGMPGDVCPMPAAEAGVAIDEDMPIFGACAIQCNTTCDGSLMGNGIMARKYEEYGIPTFQIAAPLRHTEKGVTKYAAQEIRNAIAFIENTLVRNGIGIITLNVQKDSTKKQEIVLDGWKCQERCIHKSSVQI